MERMTARGEHGVSLVMKSKECGGSTEDMCRQIKEREQEAFERLAAYEDTGLEPREVMALIAENQRLHEENFWLTSEREPVPGWIAMADKPPEEDGSYIVCTKLGAVCTAHFTVKKGRWGHSMYGVTHWMPLPKAPEEEKR